MIRKILMWLIIIAVIGISIWAAQPTGGGLLATETAQFNGVLIGEEHLTDNQKQFFDAAMRKPCKARIILLTPMPHPMYVGYAYGPLIRIYGVHSLTPIELYCATRHECREAQLGEEHDWEYVWNECREELHDY